MIADRPLVSCVMPTFNRSRYLPAAIDCFLKQTYPNKELVIVDDSNESSRPLLDSSWPVRYVFIAHRILGAKRNECCELAKGDIICHFDDDDWSAPDRIKRQVELLEASGKPVTGYSNIYYWNIIKHQARVYRSSVKGYVCGGTLCFYRSWWEKNKFPTLLRGSDNTVVYKNIKNIQASMELGAYVARAHDTNIGGDKSNIGVLVDKAMIPSGFWENENLRLTCKAA